MEDLLKSQGQIRFLCKYLSVIFSSYNAFLELETKTSKLNMSVYIVTPAWTLSQKGLKMLEDQKMWVFSCCCLTKLISVCRPCPVSKLRRPDWQQRVDEEELPAGQTRYRWGHDRPWAQRTHCRPGSSRWWVILFDRKFDPSFFFFFPSYPV